MSRRALGQITIVLAGVGVYELLRVLLVPDWPLARRHAREVLSLEQVLRLDWEIALQRPVAWSPSTTMCGWWCTRNSAVSIRSWNEITGSLIRNS